MTFFHHRVSLYRSTDTFQAVHNKPLFHFHLRSWVKIFCGNCQTLHEKCPYPEFFWSSFSRIQTEYGKILRISLFSVQMEENTSQKTSKYGYFSRSEYSEKEFKFRSSLTKPINKGVFKIS